MTSHRLYLVSIFVVSIFLNPASAGAVCSLITVTATSVSFGNYNSSMGSSANGTVSSVCTLGGNLPSFTVALSAGGSGSFTQRKMSLLTQTLNYNLYTTASFAAVWGDGTGSTVTQSYNASGNQSTVNFTVYGNMPNNQFPTPGIYGDLITVTVSY